MPYESYSLTSEPDGNVYEGYKQAQIDGYFGIGAWKEIITTTQKTKEMKATTFSIAASPHLLEAIMVDLRTMGYRLYIGSRIDRRTLVLAINLGTGNLERSSKEDFCELYPCDWNEKKDKEYHLPDITFEQFKKFVLKEEVEVVPTFPALPEKWCIFITEKSKPVVQQSNNVIFDKGYDYTLGCWYSPKYNDYKGHLSHPGYEEITVEMFKHYFLEEGKTEGSTGDSGFQLPDKWCVKRDLNNYKEINTYFNSLKGNSYSDDRGWMHFPAVDVGSTGEHLLRDYRDVTYNSDYTPITFEQFKKYVLNKKTENMKKIIGYKAPFNINALVSKDTLYVKDTSGNYCPESKKGTGSQWYLPPQIVEQWTPEYKKESVELSVSYTNGTLEVLLKEKDKFIIKGEGEFDISVLRDLAVPAISSTLMGGAFTIVTHPGSIDVGCKKGISVEDVKKVLAAHDELFGS